MKSLIDDTAMKNIGDAIEWMYDVDCTKPSSTTDMAMMCAGVQHILDFRNDLIKKLQSKEDESKEVANPLCPERPIRRGEDESKEKEVCERAN